MAKNTLKRVAQVVAGLALIVLAVLLRIARREPKVAIPVAIVAGIAFAIALAIILRERIRRQGAAGWWALLGTLALPVALFGHMLYWGSHVVLEPRYQLSIGLAVGGTLAVAVAFRRALNPRLAQVLGALGALSLLAKLVAMRPMLPLRTTGPDWTWIPAPWTEVGMLVPALGALVVVLLIARPLGSTPTATVADPPPS